MLLWDRRLQLAAFTRLGNLGAHLKLLHGPQPPPPLGGRPGGGVTPPGPKGPLLTKFCFRIAFPFKNRQPGR